MREKAIHLIKQYKTFVITMLVFGFITYYLMISQQLTNQLDAFWLGKYYLPRNGVLSEGRFIWRILSPLLFGMQLDAYSTLLALFFIALGLIVLHNIFYMNQSPKIIFYIISAVFLTTVGIRSQLSYRFQSPFFGLAFLCSMLSAWCIVRLSNHVVSVLVGAFFVMLSMGNYQADLGCTLLVLLIVLLTMVYQSEKSQTLLFMIRCVLSVLSGLILYFLLWKIILLINHVDASYRIGENGLSIISMLKSFPQNCKRSFRNTYSYFFSGNWNENMFQDHLWLFGFIFLLFFIGTCILLYNLIKERKYIPAVIFLVLHLLIPIFSCCFFFIGTKVSMNIQTTIAVGMIIPLYFIMLCILLPDSDQKSYLVYKYALSAWVILILYGNFFSVQIDQQAMMEGTNALTIICNDMLDDLAEEGYFDIPKEERKPIAVIGSAEQNEQFHVSPIFYKANIYAKIGDFEFDCERVSWEAAFRELCYKDVSFVDRSTYYELIERGEVQESPLYPARGYLLELDDAIVLKVSEH